MCGKFFTIINVLILLMYIELQNLNPSVSQAFIFKKIILL